MLTKELLKFRRRGGFQPAFIDAADPALLRLAGELLEIYRGAREARMTRGELEELTEALIRQAPDRVLAAGLNSSPSRRNSSLVAAATSAVIANFWRNCPELWSS